LGRRRRVARDDLQDDPLRGRLLDHDPQRVADRKVGWELGGHPHAVEQQRAARAVAVEHPGGAERARRERLVAQDAAGTGRERDGGGAVTVW